MKQPGHCTNLACERECFSVETVYTEAEGPEVAGWPRQLGPPHEHAMRVSLVLVDGSRMDVTLCDECAPNASERLPAIHRAIRERWAFEGTNGKREQLRGESLTLKQQWMQGAEQLFQVNNVPLGVLYVESWRDAYRREHGRSAR